MSPVRLAHLFAVVAPGGGMSIAHVALRPAAAELPKPPVRLPLPAALAR